MHTAQGHKRIAIKQANTQALNDTQGHKRNYQQDDTLALNTTQGYKRSYQQAITLALNTTQGYKRSYQQAILYIPPVNLAIMCRGNLMWPTRKYLFESIVKVG